MEAIKLKVYNSEVHSNKGVIFVPNTGILKYHNE